MNELELLMRLRDEIPLTEARPAVESAVLAAIREPAVSGSARGPRAVNLARARLTAIAPLWRHRGLRTATAGALALAAGAAGVIGIAASRASAPGPQVIPWSGRPTLAWQNNGYPRLGRAQTEAQLVGYASRAAVLAPGRAPRAHEWVFIKSESAVSSAGWGGFLFGPPDERLIGLGWIRADWREYATGVTVPASLPPTQVVHGSLRVLPGPATPGGGFIFGGWKSISYSYLNALPTDPERLESVILAYNKPGAPRSATPDNVAIFNAIAALLQGQSEGVWIPPKLAATMYRVLQRLPGVHFESGTDLAGRTGLGLYMVIDGWYKQELVINPLTYTYMGEKSVAVTAHKSVATDGTRYIRKGQVLGWDALLELAIVQHPGQLP